MNTDQFVERLRQTGMIPTVSENWGTEALLAEATEALRTRFAEDIVNTQSGYWRHSEVVDTVSGQNEYRINPRAIVQGLQKFEFSADGGRTWNLMRIVTLGSDGLYESTNRGTPRHYSHYSDYVRVFPTPGDNPVKFRFSFYLSPSTLVETAEGGVVAATQSPGFITVNGDPTTYLSASGGLLDLVNTTGCNEVVLFDVPYSTITDIGGGQWNIAVDSNLDLSRLRAGQVVRAADTTDQIPLPRELQNGFVTYTTASVLQNIGDNEQAEKLAAKASGDIRRILDLAIPRDKAHPQKIKPRNSWLRRNAGQRR